MKERGWSSRDLPVVCEDQTLWTTEDAARWLGPQERKLSMVQVRWLVELHELKPVGKRRTTSYGTSGRYARVYNSLDLIKAYDTLTPRKEMLPELGRIVLYTLTEDDAVRIRNKRDGALVKGSGVRAGQQVAGIIVNPGQPPSTESNLHIFLDANHSDWVVGRPQGRGEGQWSWPPVR